MEGGPEMKFVLTMSLGLFVASAGAAAANTKAARACAAGLAPEARTIYEAAAPSIKPDTVIKDMLPGIVRPMVFAGKVSRRTGRQSARAAGACLVKLK